MDVQISLPDLPVATIPARNGWLENLASLRQEWEEAASGDSLLDVTASVGLMLLDIATKLGLTPDERLYFLGHRLGKEADALSADYQE